MEQEALIAAAQEKKAKAQIAYEERLLEIDRQKPSRFYTGGLTFESLQASARLVAQKDLEKATEGVNAVIEKATLEADKYAGVIGAGNKILQAQIDLENKNKAAKEATASAIEKQKQEYLKLLDSQNQAIKNYGRINEAEAEVSAGIVDRAKEFVSEAQKLLKERQDFFNKTKSELGKETDKLLFEIIPTTEQLQEIDDVYTQLFGVLERQLLKSGTQVLDETGNSVKFNLDFIKEQYIAYYEAIAQTAEKAGKKLEADTADGLKAQLQSADAQKALKDYQDKAAMNEKDLAIAQQTISEKQAIDVNIIKEAVLKSMSQDQQKELLASIKKSNEDVGKAMTTVANSSATVTGPLVTDANTATSTGAKAFADGVKVSDDLLKNAFKNISLESDVVDNGNDDNLDPDNDTGLEDGFIDKGTPKFIKSGKNKLLPSIDDQILVAPNITDYISKSQKLNEMTGSLTDMMGGGKVGGAIDININVGGAVTGDRNADVSKIFNDPKVQKQIMDTVLYKLDAYKRQQGVLK
jgi:hypothetical protein